MLKMNCTSPKPKLFATYRCSEREKTQSFNPIKRPRPNLHGSEICPDACQRGLRVCLKTESKLATRIKIKEKNIRLRKTCFPISNIYERSAAAVIYHCESRLVSVQQSFETETQTNRKIQNKNLLDCCLYCYWQNIRNSHRKFLLEANKIVMFRTCNFLHTCYILYT